MAETEQQIYKRRAFEQAALEIRKLPNEIPPDINFQSIPRVGKATARIITEWFKQNPSRTSSKKRQAGSTTSTPKGKRRKKRTS